MTRTIRAGGNQGRGDPPMRSAQDEPADDSPLAVLAQVVLIAVAVLCTLGVFLSAYHYFQPPTH